VPIAQVFFLKSEKIGPISCIQLLLFYAVLPCQINICLNQFETKDLEILIALDSIPGFSHILLFYEHGGTATADAETELIIGSVFDRAVSCLAGAPRRPADIPLLADAAGEHRAKLGDFTAILV
jgi:hypothetical protein